MRTRPIAVATLVLVAGGLVVWTVARDSPATSATARTGASVATTADVAATSTGTAPDTSEAPTSVAAATEPAPTTTTPPSSSSPRVAPTTARQRVPAPPAPPFASSITTVSAVHLHDSYRPGCPVGPDELRLVTVSHWDFAGRVQTGRLVVHAAHAGGVAEVFHRLYERRFPIERMQPVEAYGGSDDASMAANNTSGFNCRPVTGGTGFSEHSYGWAIDLDPVQNPYVKGPTVLPPSGRAHLSRAAAPGVIRSGDPVVAAFASIGWSWGGAWSSPRDYQHFSATNH